jgi:hypothetical protein
MKPTCRNSTHAWACSKAHPANTGRNLNTCTHSHRSGSSCPQEQEPSQAPPCPSIPNCMRAGQTTENASGKRNTLPLTVIAQDRGARNEGKCQSSMCTVKGQRARPARYTHRVCRLVDSRRLHPHPHPHVLCSSVTPQLRPTRLSARIKPCPPVESHHSADKSSATVSSLSVPGVCSNLQSKQLSFCVSSFT